MMPHTIRMTTRRWLLVVALALAINAGALIARPYLSVPTIVATEHVEDCDAEPAAINPDEIIPDARARHAPDADAACHDAAGGVRR